MNIEGILIAALLGTFLGGSLFWIPGFRYLPLLGILINWSGSSHFFLTDPTVIMVFYMALLISASFVNTIPAFLFSAPQPVTFFLVGPGRKYLREGRAYQGCMTVGTGSMIGVGLIIVLSPFFLNLFRPVIRTARPYYPLILGLLILYMVGGEIILHLKRYIRTRRKNDFRNIFLAPGIFLLISIFGITVFESKIDFSIDFPTTITAVLSGLILFPSLIAKLINPVMSATVSDEINDTRERKFGVRGGFGGLLGGLMAIMFPGISSGLGAFLSGHVSGSGREKSFLISQGVCKTLLAGGSFLLLFIPYRHIYRGSLAIAFSPYYPSPQSPRIFYLMVGIILMSGCLAYFILAVVSRFSCRLVTKINGRLLSISIITVITAVIGFQNFQALVVLFTATCLGSLPLICGCRRSNIFAIFLMPIFMRVVGLYNQIVEFFNGFF